MNNKVETKESLKKKIILYIVSLILLLASPFIMCGPQTIKVGKVYALPLWDHVVYFKKGADHSIVFGERHLGPISTYRVSGFSLYDNSGKKVGTISGGINSATVNFYDNLYNGELNGNYSIDH